MNLDEITRADELMKEEILNVFPIGKVLIEAFVFATLVMCASVAVFYSIISVTLQILRWGA